MKRFIYLALIVFGLALSGVADVTAKSKGGTTSVRGYTKKNGTYVAPHKRSSPNPSKNDNWSTKGNRNPYTGKPGTKNP